MYSDCSTQFIENNQSNNYHAVVIKNPRNICNKAKLAMQEIFSDPECISDESISKLYIPCKLQKKSTNSIIDIEKMLAWRNDVCHAHFDEKTENEVSSLHFSDNPYGIDLSTIAKNIQGLFFNINWFHDYKCQDVLAHNEKIFMEVADNFHISES